MMENLLKKSVLICLALVCMGLMTVSAQTTLVTTPGTEIECPPGSTLLGYSWSQDALSPTGTSFSSATLFGDATAINGLNELSLSWEFEPTDGRIVNFDNGLRTNTGQNATSTTTISLNETLENPIVNLNDLQGGSTVEFFDCDGVPLNPVILTASANQSVSGNTLTSTSGVGATSTLQFVGSVSCFYFNTTAGPSIGTAGEGVTVQVRTCVAEEVPPPCVDCGMDSYKYISLSGATGTTTGSTANVNLNGVKIGDAEIVYSDLSIGGDITGTAFGAFARGNATTETFILRMDLCEPLAIQQLDVLGLETESQVWVGTSLSGMGAGATVSGLTLSACGGTNAAMNVDDNTMNQVTNKAKSCRNQGNGKYTVSGGAVSTLFFKYFNMAGGCNFDKATFRIAACVPDAVEVVPACPLTRVTITEDAAAIAAGTEPSSSTTYVKDANGVYFAASLDCGEVYAASEAGTALAPASVSPCAEVIDEMDCLECTPVPPCTACAENETYEYINLANYNATTGEGDIFLDGVLIGTSKVIENTLAISEDLRGTRFGAFASGSAQTEVLIMELDFCEPLAIQQIDILGLEDQSQVWVGTTLSGSDVTGGTIDDCGMNTDSGMLIDGTSNTVINQANNCRNQGDGNYQFSVASVSTLYFKYENMAGSCNYDKTTYRIGVCTAPAPLATPECSLELYSVVTTDLDNPVDLYRDANGLWFPTSVCATAKNPVEVQSLKISPCMAPVFKSICENCFIPPVIGEVSCDNGRVDENGDPLGDPIITQPFTITATGLENMKAADNNEKDFGLNAYLYPAGTTAADFAYPPVAISIADAVALGTQPAVPVLLGPLVLNADCTSGSLTVVLPADFPQGDYAKVTTLNMWPEGEDPADQPSAVAPDVEVIPTMGQWALFVLALLMSSLAVVRIRQSKNQEAKHIA